MSESICMFTVNNFSQRVAVAYRWLPTVLMPLYSFLG